jgi:alpha-beta hydrolase superfamily lysophospholipase
MASSIDYRRYAEDCLRLAERASSPETKSVLKMLAGAWHRLAQEREAIERPADGVVAPKRRPLKNS